MSLADMNCVPCRGGTLSIELARARQMLGELSSGWELNRAGYLQRTYLFKNFILALEFAGKVGAIAETEGHHPDLYIAWGKCRVEVWTHKINGLTESDFYLGAKADRTYESMPKAAAP